MPKNWKGRWQTNGPKQNSLISLQETDVKHLHPHIIPHVAIVDENTLAAMGLAGIIERMMPGVDISLFPDSLALQAQPGIHFQHYFVSTRAMAEAAPFFLSPSHHTIVLVHGKEASGIPKGLPTLNVCQSETELVKSILQLAERSHAAHRVHPLRPAHTDDYASSPLTPRETQVLKGIVTGKLNKEIADELGVGTATIISHRKNIIEKLQVKSVSGLTIFAVMHGIVRAEEI